MDRSVCIRCKVNPCAQGYHFCAECRSPRRICKVCGEEKPLTEEFYQKYWGRDNYFIPTCKKCRSKAASARQKKRRDADPEYHELIKEWLRKSGKKIREANPDYGRVPQCTVCGSTEHRRNWHTVIQEKSQICNNCGIEKPLTEEFWFKNPHGYAFKLLCRTCSNEVSKKYQRDNWGRLYEKRKQRASEIIEALRAYRARRGCINCEESNPDLLQFHHTNPDEKKFGPATSAGTQSIRRIEKELEKCVILCYACHKKYHREIP